MSDPSAFGELDENEADDRRAARLLDLDPDLAQGIDPAHFELARSRSHAVLLPLIGPRWDPTPLCRAARPGWLGLFLVDGLMIRQVSVGSRAACELFGPGDLIRPWDADGEYEPLPISLEWQIPKRATIAVLGTRFALRMAGWPMIVSALMARVATRGRSLALQQAVSHLAHTDSRLLIMFWLLGERWGKVTSDGIRITLPLTHELLAMLTGVRRPSATLALQRLTRAGLLIREGRDRWLLTANACDQLRESDDVPVIAQARTRR